MAVWAQTNQFSQTCYDLLISKPSAPLGGGKASPPSQVRCEDTADLDPVNAPVSDLSGSLWAGGDGRRFVTSVGRAAGAAEVKVVAGNSTVTVAVDDGWFAYAQPYSARSGGYTEYSYAADGHLLAKASSAAETPGEG